MKQSVSSNLRWTMVDRGGAEAYATSRHASVELPQLNRRFRAAVWLGRRLQDPLGELLKLDTTRLRLGSYQRELPQEPLKRLVTATLSDCLCVKGVDARYASEQQFSYVPGVTPEIATKLGEMAAKREFTSREALVSSIADWSETGKRQALGFLRIYQSPETLDGTLIHPDDYRLAQRLIEATELTARSSTRRLAAAKIKVPKAPKQAPAPAADTAAAVTEGSELAVDAPADAQETWLARRPRLALLQLPPQKTRPRPHQSPQRALQRPPNLPPRANPSRPLKPAAKLPLKLLRHRRKSRSLSLLQPEYSEDVVTEQAAAPAIDTGKARQRLASRTFETCVAG